MGNPRKVVSCPRCGVEQVRYSTAVRPVKLCKDCRGLLSEHDRMEWAA